MIQVPITELLGATWRPSPMTTAWMKVVTPHGSLHLLVVETPVGRAAYAFDQDALAGFIRDAQEQLTGLTLPVSNELIR